MGNVNPEPAGVHLTQSLEQHPWHRYVALGDSFTVGYGDPDPLSPGGYRGWADYVARELSRGQADFSYANLAIRGVKVRQVVEKQLAQAINLTPDLVTFQAGGNDLIRLDADPDKLAAAVEPAIEALCATGATVLIFVGPDSGPRTVLGHVRSKIALFNESLRAIATRNDAKVADLWALRDLSDPRTWDRDRLHLSPIGHQKVAALVLDSLNVPHSFEPFEFDPLPAQTWRQTKAGDLIWTKEYLVPWVLRGFTRHISVADPPAKRPSPGPVHGYGSA
ncbi:SGNH/GDSL hydrolase family protein [Paeniglutamicibacter kerguelensis]|uniref:Lysophospholipase L1-like esterase n=1 Tax=Paeniglutamicibacter kerguelensis TaxID=254788 RepID=A0ABS4XD46_9MICC|nr:SGNH/GDSL hydrolase family protein [Paeniglutamicibacter kerguelensis]MBP2386201.1 lysophospholipase L1-like esterase [Paeniglutamicibacter kerguelensis]